MITSDSPSMSVMLDFGEKSVAFFTKKEKGSNNMIIIFECYNAEQMQTRYLIKLMLRLSKRDLPNHHLVETFSDRKEPKFLKHFGKNRILSLSDILTTTTIQDEPADSWDAEEEDTKDAWDAESDKESF